MKKINNAIILNGPGRSGTTLLYQILANHEDLAWTSSYNDRYPNLPRLAYLNLFFNNRLFGLDWYAVKKVPKPSEAYGFWLNFFPSFNELESNDSVSGIDEQAERAIRTIHTIVRSQRGNRFVTKITGTPRIEYIDQVFDSNYKVVWIERDPRVVVSSIMKQRWFYKDKPSEFNTLNEEDKIRFYTAYYKKLHFRASEYPDKILVRYEDLIENKMEFFEVLCRSLDLDFSSRFQKIIENWPIRKVDWSNYNSTYSESGNKLLGELLESEMSSLGYL